jgi:ribose transport system ATP-binding protein
MAWSSSAGDHQKPVVETRCLSKTFGKNRVLDQVNLSLLEGQVHGLLGENGSGKSTLIKVLSGFHLPDAGSEVEVEGIPIRLGSPPASKAAGLRFVHQNLGVIGELNAVENVALDAGFLNNRWIQWKKQARYTRELLDELHVDIDLTVPLGQCRPVDRAAVAIARAVRGGAGRVRLLVLDEPTAALPPAEVSILFAILRESCKKGIAVLYVSHRLDEIAEITDHISVLRDGKLIGTRRTGETAEADLVEMILGSRQALPIQDRRATVQEAPSRPPALRVQRLRSERLFGIDLTVAPGEIVGVAGIDGSGREDLARAIVGAIPSTAEISVGGQPISTISPRRAAAAGVAIVLGTNQAGSCIAQFSTRENLTLATLQHFTRWGSLRRRPERRSSEEWIKLLNVRPPDPERPLVELSGGNKQKVALGKWLSSNCTVMVLDDPTAGVDVGARRSIYNLIFDQAARGVAFVVCSSDLEDLAMVCGRVLILRDGLKVAELESSDVAQAKILEKMSA